MIDVLKAPSTLYMEEAKAAHAAAEKETAECKARVAGLDAEIRKAVDRYDREPTEERGEEAIASRKARDLASLRTERAEKRQAVARAELAKAEQAHAVARAEYDVARAKVAAALEVDKLEKVCALVESESGPTKLLAAVKGGVEVIGASRDAIRRQGKDVAAARRTLLDALKRLAHLDPSAQEQLAETKATADAAQREAASVVAFHKGIVGYAAMISAGAALMLEGMRGMVAAFEEANGLVSEARAAKLAASEIDKAHVASAALLALCEALPERLPITWAAGVIAGYLLDDQGIQERGFARERPLGWLLNVWCSAVLDGSPPRFAINQRDARDADAARAQLREVLSFAKPIDARLAREARAEKDK